MPAPNVTVVADAIALAAAAADAFVELAAAAARERGVAHVALAGGSTPRAMNAFLAVDPRRSRVPWDRLRFYFGDERCVPPDDPESNFGMTRATLFAPLGIRDEHVARMHGEDPPAEAAAAYDDRLRAALGDPPRLDVVFLGMGPDGHTASLFPGTLAALDPERLCVANFVPKFGSYRITLTPRAINAARNVIIVAGGAEKADALADVFGGRRDPEAHPVEIVAPVDGTLRWLVDASAAARIPPAAFHGDGDGLFRPT